MIGGLLGLAAFHAAAVLGAARLTAPLRTGEAAVDLVLLLLVRLVLVTAAVVAAGWTGTLTPLGLGLPAALVLAGLLAAGARRDLPRLPRLGLAARAALGLVAIRLLLQVLFLSPHDADATGYHLPKIAEWIRAGGFTRYMGEDPLVHLSAGFEVLEASWCLFLRHDLLVEAAGAEFLLLGTTAVAGLARRMGLSPDSAALAGVLYAVVPAPALQAVSCLNDGPVAALVLAALLLADARAHPWALAAAAGLGLGIKATFVYALPGVLLLWALRRPAFRSPAPRTAWTLAGLALAAGASWYLRNLAWYGNPLYPAGTALLDRLDMPPQVGLRWDSLAGNTAAYLGRYAASTEPLTGIFEFNAGWGAIGLAGAAALVAAVRAGALPMRWVGALAASAGCVFLAVAADPWASRFVSFLVAPLALAAAWAATRSRLVAAVVLVAAVAQAAGTTLPLQYAGRPLLPPGRPYVDPTLGEIPAADRVGLSTNWRMPQYLLYGPDFRRAVVPLRPKGPETFPDLLIDSEVAWACVLSRGGWMASMLDRQAERGTLRRAPPCWYGLPASEAPGRSR